jgi:hypothetical protein
MQRIKKMKVVRVDKYEFELENGQVFEHIEPLDEVPSLEEFQKIYDACCNEMNKKLEESEK